MQIDIKEYGISSIKIQELAANVGTSFDERW